MAKDLPYLFTYKNVGTLFDKIEKAKIPEVFTLKFLTDTIGLKASTDRKLITLLKKLGFLDNAGKPTPAYNLLKNKATAKAAIANGIRTAYAPLFEANEAAYSLPSDGLKGLVAQLTGAEEGVIKLIAGTFNALSKTADFTVATTEPAEDQNQSNSKEPPLHKDKLMEQLPPASKFSPDFHFNIQVHLPSNGSEETYLAIFNALRRSLG